MYSFELITTYMKAKNYTQAKQAAIDLGYSDAFLTNVKKGKKNISEETAIYIAERCGMDVNEVLIKLQAEKAKSDTERNAWTAMLKKYKHGITQINSITISGLLLAMPSLNDFALCKSMLNIVFLLKTAINGSFEVLNEQKTQNT